MKSRKINYKQIITAGDILPIIIILAGLFIAIFMQDIAFKLIGVSVSVLGAVAFGMNISQRLSDLVEPRFQGKSASQEYKMTIRKDSSAKRKVIEDFDSSFGPEKQDEPKKPDQTMGADEGFRIIKKVKKAADQPAETKQQGISDEERIQNLKNKAASFRYEIKQIPEEDAQSIPFKDETIFAAENKESVSGITKDEKNIDKTPEGEKVDNGITDRGEKVTRDEDNIPENENTEPQKEREELSNTEEAIKLNEQQGEDVSENLSEAEKDTEKTDIDQNKSLSEKPAFRAEAKTEDYKLNIEIKQPEQLEKTESDDIEDELSEAELNHIKAKADKYKKSSQKEDKESSALKDDTNPEQEKTNDEEELQENFFYKEKHIDLPLSLLTEDIPRHGREPRKEFEYFLSRVLMVIRTVTPAKTAAFILANSENNELILESYVTSIPEAVSHRMRFPVGNDIVSQIYKNAKPEILSEINPAAELDLIPYYNEQVNTRSFIGMPVFYNNTVIGLICADTDAPDAYDSFMVSFLGHFSKLLAAVVQSYTEKYDLLQSSKTIDAVNLFHEISSDQYKTLDEISEAIVESVSRMFEFTAIGLSIYDSETGGWQVKAIHATEEKYTGILGRPVDLENSLLGKCMVSGSSIVTAPVDLNTLRVAEGEVTIDGGYFAAVPLSTGTSTYGALYMEGTSRSGITSLDVSILETIGKHAGTAIEKMHMIELLNRGTMIDYTSGLYNPATFLERTREEVTRSHDFQFPTTLCSFRIDKYESFDPEIHTDRFEKARAHVISILKGQTKIYDLLGKIDDSTIGLLLSGVALTQGQLWAEKIRNEIAISMIEIDGRKYNVTVSIGIAPLQKEDSAETLIENSLKVLEKSSARTNSVAVFT